ncbi:hypothetical protein AALP_AA2G052300 [Arabis alpina]|uniref:Uncharacterized protein n=1 Tax=Arabis alpina TaxID=50452 RepID=A0A087HFG9_ARAAL|nr:hypothetical protein AALP_AA2G052300 [Arabis alpina]
MTKTFESTSFTPERNASLGVDHETPPISSDLSASLTEIEASSSRFASIYANTSEQAGVNLKTSTPVVDIWNSEYWAAEMRGVNPGIPAFTIPSILIRSRKYRRLSEVSNKSDAEEETPAVKDGSQKIPSATDTTDMQRADHAPAWWSVINAGNRIVNAYEAEVQRREDKIKNLTPRYDVDAAWQEVCRQMSGADSWEATASENQQSLNDLFDQTCALKEETHKLEDEVNKRDVHLEAASTEIGGLRANLEESRFTKDCLRKERNEARRRADEIASGSSARGARHSSRLERIRLYLIALHAQAEVKAQLC